MTQSSLGNAKPSKKRSVVPPIPSDELATMLLRFLSVDDAVLTPKEGHQKIKAAGFNTNVAEVATAFENAVRDGKAFRHPTGKKTGGLDSAYCRVAPEELVLMRLNELLRTEGEFTVQVLRKVMPTAYVDLVDEIVGRLISERRLFERPGSVKAKKYTTKPVPPTQLLSEPQRKQLDGILVKVNAARAKALRLSDLLKFLDGDESSNSTGTSATNAPVINLQLLMTLYRSDLPSRGGLTRMPIPITWRSYVSSIQGSGGVPNRDAFERILLESAESGLVELTCHERPASLSPDEAKAALIRPEGQVLYFWRPIKDA